MDKLFTNISVRHFFSHRKTFQSFFKLLTVGTVFVLLSANGAKAQTYATLPYSTGFESGSFDASWTTQSDEANGEILVNTAENPNTGTYHVTMASSVDNDDVTNEAWLHLDLSGYTQVDLEFYWQDLGDENSTPTDGVYFSDDGGSNFTLVYDFNPEGNTDDTYNLLSLDVDALAAANTLTLSSTFVIKFQQDDNYTLDFDGITIDDISVTAPYYAPLPYSTSFESGTFDTNWITQSDEANGEILINTAENPNTGTYHVTMASSVDNDDVTNEAWLLLDLSGNTQVDLEFYWQDLGDENSTPTDGVYFSDDGGANFTLVYDFNPEGNTDDTYNLLTLDVDALAAANALTLSSTFVIKFQQDDNYSLDFDGITIDDINVTAPYYAPLPYSTSFESGTFDANWITQSDEANGEILINTAENPNTGTYHVTMASSVDDDDVTNEAWLLLDLSGNTQVDLEFYWQDLGDENSTPTDGVYFSDDGGANFTLVYDFNPEGNTDDTYNLLTLDVDALAAANALTLSSTFVIKFQQDDNYTLNFDGITIDDINVFSPIMTYISSTSTQTNLSTVSPGSTDQEIIGIQIVTSGANSPFDVTDFDFSTAGSTDASGDIDNAKLYYTGTSGTFATGNQFGSTAVNPNGTFTISGAQTLADGTNYFWLAYDIDASATVTNVVDAQVTEITIDGSDETPTVTDPAGDREILVKAAAGFPYYTGFESGSGGNEWTFSSSTGNGLAQISTANTPNTGTYHLTMERASGGGDETTYADLAIDLSGQTKVFLEYYWKDFSDEDTGDDGIWISDDGGTSFTHIFNILPASYTDDTYEVFRLDISEMALNNGLTLNADFVIRFAQEDNNPISGGDGMAIDDISLYAPSYASFPYYTSFETGVRESEWAFSSDNGDGELHITSGFTPRTGNYQITMSKHFFAGGFAANRADLYIDLSGQSSVELEFFIYDYDDEEVGVDGIFLSDDGGVTFTNIHTLNMDSYVDFYYNRIAVDIAQAAIDNGLSLNATNVIRIQQEDDATIDGGFKDGFAIDDISVRASPCDAPNYATLPYSEGFETGSMGDEWCFPIITGARTTVTNEGTPYSGNGHLAMDALSGGSDVTNEALLHLDLTGETEVTLEFYWKDFGDENDATDAVYFSDDGGANFYSVFSFTPESVTDGVWNLETLDVDAIVAGNANLDLTSTFVIKFSQTDDQSRTNFADADGIAFDEIAVYGTATNWTGNTNNRWNNAGNWSNGIPDCSTVAIIPDVSGASGNFPILGNSATFEVGRLIIQANASVTISSNRTLTICSDFENYGTMDMGDGTIEFRGTQLQTITGAIQFGNILMNNSGAGIELNDDISLDGMLTFTDGMINTNFNTLSFDDGADVTGASTSNYVVGPVEKTGTTTNPFEFPVGSASLFAPVEIDITTGDASSVFTVQYYDAQPINILSFLSPDPNGDLGLINPNEYWEIDNTGTASTADLTFYFNNLLSSGIVLMSLQRVAHYNGSNWENLGSDAYTQGLNVGSISVDGVSSFSPFSSGTPASVLPVEFLSFDAEVQEGKVLLDWATASEINNDFFEIQRSENGQNWEVIGEVAGNGTVNEITDYTFDDTEPLFGKSYYRLRQVDYDGQFDYSPIVAVDITFEGREMSVIVFPNPARQHDINLRISTQNQSNNVAVRLIDISGRIYYDQLIKPESFYEDIKIIPNRDLNAGVYVLEVMQNDIISKHKIIVVE